MKEESYDASAELYDAAFQDMKVRDIEWDYVVGILEDFAKRHDRKPNVIEIGCGNGQLLRQLLEEGYIESAVGFDASQKMVEIASDRHDSLDALSFALIEGSDLPFPDASVDIALSFMSYRYLDWPTLMAEVDRVLIDDGNFIMVDMAVTELTEADMPLYEETRKRTQELHAKETEFAYNLKKLVAAPQWKAMLAHHPRREATEYETFLTGRYPTGDWKRLYVCFDHSLFGFQFTK